MAGAKGTKRDVSTTEYMATDLLPAYTNTVRIKVTEDNVYLDFGFVDPVQQAGAPAQVVSRVIMNRSTFQTFAKHVGDAASEAKAKVGEIGAVILSRCPPKVEK